MARLKVFRTPIGFHDAYVAAPSRKAALLAWGADKDLFARGAAEEVTDPALTEAPLATPGKVVKVSRGGRAEQLAALPEKRTRRPATTAKRSRAPSPPKPSREALDLAERALADAETRHAGERAELAKEEAALARRKREVTRAHDLESERLEQARAGAETDYRQALADWRQQAG